MEVDRGSALSLIPSFDFEKFKKMNTNVELNLIRVRGLKFLGKARVKLKLSVRRKCVLDLYEVKIGNNPLFGCEWLKALPVDLKRSTSQ